jgi:excisionase family DNA binding protein
MKNKDKMTKYISVAELAKILGVSRITVFNKIKNNKIPAEKLGRAYAIPMEFVRNTFFHDTGVLTEEKKKNINKIVERVIREYGETLKLLGKE